MKHLAIMCNELAVSFKPIRDSVNCFDDGRKQQLFQKIENIQQ